MNDPDATAYFIRDISPTLEGGTWRWVIRRPEMRIYLDSTARLKFTADFTISETTFSHTGPVTVSFVINDHLLDKTRYASPGPQHFEKPVPESFLKPRWVNFVVMEPDKTWVSPEGVTFGFILTRAGFAEMP